MNLFQSMTKIVGIGGAFFDSMKVFTAVGLMDNPVLASFSLYVAHQAATDFLKKTVVITAHQAGISPSKSH